MCCIVFFFYLGLFYSPELLLSELLDQWTLERLLNVFFGEVLV